MSNYSDIFCFEKIKIINWDAAMAHVHKQIDITLLLSVQAHRKQPPSSQKVDPPLTTDSVLYCAHTMLVVIPTCAHASFQDGLPICHHC